MWDSVYSHQMSMRIIVSAAFMANALLSSFCMMPMAMAADMPMHHDDEATEMAMTPMVPMSPAHCEHCAHVDEQNDSPIDGGCAGHCLAKAHDALVKITSVSTTKQFFVALAPSFSTLVETSDISEKSTTSFSPPINLVLERSVVMIQ